MEKISFLKIFFESWRLSFARPHFFVFGLLLTISTAVRFFVFPSSETLTLPFLKEFLENHLLFVFLFIILSFLLATIGKSSLVMTLAKEMKNDRSSHSVPLPSLIPSIKKGFLIDLSLALFFLCLIIILLLPALVAILTLNTLPSALSLLSLTVLLLIGIAAFFIREFAYFYYLLSPLGFRSALESSALLFHHYRFLSLLFGLCFLSVTLLFTFSWNLVMLGIVALTQKIFPAVSENAVFLIGILVFFSWYELFRQSAWLIFFRHLALPKKDASEEEPLSVENGTPEVPGA